MIRLEGRGEDAVGLEKSRLGVLIASQSSQALPVGHLPCTQIPMPFRQRRLGASKALFKERECLLETTHVRIEPPQVLEARQRVGMVLADHAPLTRQCFQIQRLGQWVAICRVIQRGQVVDRIERVGVLIPQMGSGPLL